VQDSGVPEPAMMGTPAEDVSLEPPLTGGDLVWAASRSDPNCAWPGLAAEKCGSAQLTPLLALCAR